MWDLFIPAQVSEIRYESLISLNECRIGHECWDKPIPHEKQ